MSNKFNIAHLREQGEDLIIVPLTDSFGNRSDADQEAAWETLQVCAASAGLAGTVCLVWNSAGRFAFLAPTAWHAFFRSIDMLYVESNINRELTCG